MSQENKSSLLNNFYWLNVVLLSLEGQIKFPLFPNSWGFGCCVTSGLSSKYSIVPTFRRRASSVAGDSNADYILRKESFRKTAIKAPKVCESCTKYVPPHAILLYIQNINTLQLYNKISLFSEKEASHRAAKWRQSWANQRWKQCKVFELLFAACLNAALQQIIKLHTAFKVDWPKV